VVAVIYGSLPWMLGEEEGLSGNLTSRSSGRQSDGCDRAARSGNDNDLSSGENEFWHKRNPKEGGEWMRQRIMRLLTPFIWQRREGKQYCGGETVDGEWSYSILSFQGEERKGWRLFWKGKGASEVALGSRA
jgi:hypothetical protein